MEQAVYRLGGVVTHRLGARTPQVVAAAVLLCAARLALVSLGFQRTARIIDRLSRSATPRAHAGSAQVLSSAYEVALAAAFLPFRILCLERSLVLYYRLRRDGVPVTLRMGVRALPFGAHAWVEVSGIPVHDDRDHLRDFNPIFELNG